MSYERDAWCEEQYSAACARVLLGDAEAGEGFAGTAGHDEFATVMFLEACEGFLDGFPLVWEQLFAGLGVHLAGLADAEAAPVDAAVIQVLDTDAGHGDLLVEQSVFSVARPFIGCADDYAAPEWFFAAGREEAVEVFFDQGAVRVEEFALHGDDVAGVTFLQDEVDAGIGLAVPVWPVLP